MLYVFAHYSKKFFAFILASFAPLREANASNAHESSILKLIAYYD
jgi:hypothetical protein